MLVNLTDIFLTEGKTGTMDVSVEMEAFESRFGSYPVLEKTPIHFCFAHISNDRAKVSGSGRIVLEMQCDRCLRDVRQELILDFEREVSPVLDEGAMISEEDDAGVMEGYSLNTETLIYNEILMNQPEKVLCKADCKGICKVCGHDLNDGECGCDTFVPDPRMAVLQDIFNANKEV